MPNRPILGAALDHDSLAAHRDWLLEAPRDLELQAFVTADVLNSNWSGLVDETLRLLDGHKGRLGIRAVLGLHHRLARA